MKFSVFIQRHESNKKEPKKLDSATKGTCSSYQATVILSICWLQPESVNKPSIIYNDVIFLLLNVHKHESLSTFESSQTWLNIINDTQF